MSPLLCSPCSFPGSYVRSWAGGEAGREVQPVSDPLAQTLPLPPTPSPWVRVA